MQHPLHEHPLHPTDARSLYPEYSGHWKCDNCSSTSTPSSIPYHCSPCSFDLCGICFEGHIYEGHPHKLFLMKMSTLYQDGHWKCDVCGLLETSMEQRYQKQAYHCLHPGCEYDVCQPCFQSAHKHKFEEINKHNALQDYICNVCSHGHHQQQSAFLIHCKGCRYTVCELCLRDHFISSHPHPLYPTQCSLLYPESSGQWKCDLCGKLGGSNIANMSTPFHCRAVNCEFDVCPVCMERDRGAPSSSGFGLDTAGPPKSAFINSYNLSGLRADSGEPIPLEKPHLVRVSCNFKPCDEDQSA